MGSYLIQKASTFRTIDRNIDKLYDSIISIYWSVLSVVPGFDDLFVDSFNSEDGIDTLSSTYVYNSDEKLLTKPALSNLVLVTITWNASAINPSKIFSVIEIETMDSFILGSDIQIYESTDNGGHYSFVPNLETYQTIDLIGYDKVYFIRGELNNVPEYNDKRIKTKVICSSLKNIKLKGIATGVSYS